MRCPYCASEMPAEAIVCAQCRRDLYLLKPLQERVEQLQAQLEEQAKTIAAEYETKIAALEQELSVLRPLAPAPASASTGAPAAPESGARSYWASVLMALIPALVLLLAAHGVLLFVYDVKPLYLRIASIMIPIPFAFALLVWHPRRIGLSTIAGFGLAFAAVYLMLVTTALIDKVPVLPQNAREVQEVLEYVASIGLAFLTGLLLGKLRHHRLSIAPQPNRAVVFVAQLFTTNKDGEMGIVRMASRIQHFVNSATPAATGAASVYAGVKALLGDGG